MKLKPFDLTRAKAGDPVVTRDGRPVKLLCFDRRGTYADIIQPIVGLVNCGDWDDINWWADDGRVMTGDDPLDLFMAPNYRKIAVNVFRNETTGQLVCSHVLFPETARTSGFAPEEHYVCTLTGEIEE